MLIILKKFKFNLYIINDDFFYYLVFFQINLENVSNVVQVKNFIKVNKLQKRQIVVKFLYFIFKFFYEKEKIEQINGCKYMIILNFILSFYVFLFFYC